MTPRASHTALMPLSLPGVVVVVVTGSFYIRGASPLGPPPRALAGPRFAARSGRVARSPCSLASSIRETERLDRRRRSRRRDYFVDRQAGFRALDVLRPRFRRRMTRREQRAAV